MITSSDWRISRLVAFDYYDGPLKGVVEVQDLAFAFEVVATEPIQELRVITLATIGEIEFCDLIAELEYLLGPAKWPVWVPVWRFDSECAQAAAEKAVASLNVGPAIAVALCDDTLENCKAIRKINLDASGDVNWFDLFSDQPMS